MKTGLAIWHYPHRTVFENVAFFAENGFESVSIHGADMLAVCAYPESDERILQTYKIWKECYGIDS